VWNNQKATGGRAESGEWRDHANEETGLQRILKCDGATTTTQGLEGLGVSIF